MSMVGRTTSVVCIFLGFLCAPCHAVAAYSACGGVLPRALTAQSMGCKMASDAGGAAISIRNFDLWAGDSALLLGVQVLTFAMQHEWHATTICSGLDLTT
eukprot:2426848-Pleurochrysis_carterae.AAC.6